MTIAPESIRAELAPNTWLDLADQLTPSQHAVLADLGARYGDDDQDLLRMAVGYASANAKAVELADIAPPPGVTEVGEWSDEDEGEDETRLFTIERSGAVAAFGLQAADGGIPEPIAVSITAGRDSVQFDDVATARAVLRDLAAVLAAVDQFDARLNTLQEAQQ